MNGVTPAMNAVCDPNNMDPDVVRARELMREIDKIVIAAYGWTDLELEYGFYDEGIGTRYMLRKDIRETILDRLVALNHKIWEEQNKGKESAK